MRFSSRLRHAAGLVALSVCAVLLIPDAHAQIPIAEARDQGPGATVTVEGTVTRAFGDFVRFQDESGPTGASGLTIRQTSGAFRDSVQSGALQQGTQLQVTGTLSEFNGLLQINNDDLNDFTIQGQGTVPAPQDVSVGELQTNGEDFESELVRVADIDILNDRGTFENDTSYPSYPLTGNVDATTLQEGTLTLRVQGSGETALAGEPIPEGALEYTGVVGEFTPDGSPNFQLIPVRPSDVELVPSVGFTQQFAQTQEGSGTVDVSVEAFGTESGDEVSVTARVGDQSTATNGTDVTGFTSPQTFTFSGDDPPPKTITFDVVDDMEEEGVERLEVVLESNDGPIARPQRFTLWVLDDPTAQTILVESDSGSALTDSLQQTFGVPRTLGIDFMRDSLYAAVYNEAGGTVEGIYSGFQVTVDPNADDPSGVAFDKGLNAEHIWPQSKGAEQEPALSDLHILAPTRAEVNSARSNFAFGEIRDAETDEWFFEDQSQSSAPPDSERPLWSELNDSPPDRDDRRFEPRHSVKGDVARAVFYFVTIYPDRAVQQFFEEQRETLLDWHQQDPVDATEVRRTLIQAGFQENVPNPYVVDSTLAERAFGEGGGQPGLVSIQEAREQGAGSLVTVEGVVTRVGPAGAYVQDSTGALFVFESQGDFGQELGQSIRRGARLEVTGTTAFFGGLLELTDVPDGGFSVPSQGNSLPNPSRLTLNEIANDGEAFESQLVRTENVAIDAGGDEAFRPGTTYSVQDETGTLALRVPEGSRLAGEPIPRRATFQGPLGQFNGGGEGDRLPNEGYQLEAIDSGDVITLLPRETTIDVTRSFGDPGTENSYRLVALPGQIDRALASTLTGDAGVEWQAFWDDGSDQDFFVRFDESDQFNLRPGRGFWVLSANNWSVNTTVNTTDAPGGTVTIPLHEGWNIVSNPLPSDASWSDVVEANGGPLQPLWRWEGGQYQQASTFVSAQAGRAFYFLNDQGLNQLAIPLTGPDSTNAVTAKATGGDRSVEVMARREGRSRARVRVATDPNAEDGKDPHDIIAPPSRFASLSMEVEAPFAEAVPARQKRLVRDVRSTEGVGQTYTLVLQADSSGPVTLEAAALPDEKQAVLVHPRTGRHHNLRRAGPLEISVGRDPTRVRLMVGSSAYVQGETTERLPDQLTVQPPAPNPFRAQTTLQYALPEAQDVRVEVYDILGRKVQTLVDGRRDAGSHRVTWDGTRGGQGRLASGTYLIRWSAGGVHRVKKVVFLR